MMGVRIPSVFPDVVGNCPRLAPLGRGSLVAGNLSNEQKTHGGMQRKTKTGLELLKLKSLNSGMKRICCFFFCGIS